MDYFSIKFKIVAIIVSLTSFPLVTIAQTRGQTCSSGGYTIATINGVFTDRDGAISNRDSLKDILPDTYHNEKVTVDFFLNPSHLGGAGDILKSIEQKVFDYETVDDYDLTEMLADASEKVKTQKLLLVAHSQGNFYANSFYDKVAGQYGGVPKESIGVYSVATPSARVAGGGRWLNSDTDKVVAGIVSRISERDVKTPNVHIDLGDEDDPLGHGFSGVYLKYRAGRVVSDIEASLQQLKENNVQDENSPCLSPPEITIAHRIEGVILAAIDPVADAGGVAFGDIAAASRGIVLVLGNTVKQAAASMFGVFDNGKKVASADNAKIDDIQIQTKQPILKEQAPPPVVAAIVPPPPVVPVIQPSQNLPVIPVDVPAPPPSNTSKPLSQIDLSGSPGFGGGGPPPENNSPDNSPPPQSTVCEDVLAVNLGNPLPCLYQPFSPMISSPSDFSSPFSTTTITFMGSSTPRFVISNNLNSSLYTTDADGSWSLTFSDLSEGANAISFYATDPSITSSQATSSPLAISFTVVIPRPDPPLISSPSFPLQIMNSQSAVFTGSTTPGFSVFNDYTNATTTADSSGSWSFSFINLAEGTTTISFYATDMTTNVWPAGLRSNPRTASFNVYNIFPTATNLSIGECSHSLSSPPYCTLPAGKATLSWDVGTPNYSYFEILKGVTVAGQTTYSLFTTTTATSTVIATKESDYSYDFKVRTVDIFGVASQNVPAQASFFISHSPPVSINEVAWAGTAASPEDGWVEVRNNTQYGIDLSNFSLRSSGGLNISLSGTISGLEYYIVDLSPDGTSVSNVSTLSISAPFDLSQAGDVLSLVFNGGVSETTIDSTPAVADCGGWCGGSTSGYATMERRQPETSGADKNNWLSNNTTTVNGSDRNNSPLNGTPGSRNSVSMSRTGFYCSPYTSSFVENGTYLPTLTSGRYLECKFLSPGFSGHRGGVVFKGVQDNATPLANFSSDTDQSDLHQQTLDIDQSFFTTTDNYFTAIFEISSGLPNVYRNEFNAFRDYFSGAAATPPNTNYEVINWKYGE